MMIQTDSIKKYSSTNIDIIQPKEVEASHERGQVTLDIDGLDLSIDSRSRVGTALVTGHGRELAIDQIRGGKFFVVDDQIVDYRFKDDLKFEHSNDSIKKLVNHIGFAQHVGSGKIIARSDLDSFTIDLGGEGTQFSTDIGFTWSPFSPLIDSMVNLIRFICDNLAAIHDPSMNFKIPMINAWEDNMSVSKDAMNHMFNRKVIPRLNEMPSERINMFDMKVLMNLLTISRNDEELSFKSANALDNILGQLSQVENIVKAHTDSAITSQNSKFIEVPITAFDAYNVASEVNTHHRSAKTANKMEGFANALIFADERKKRSIDLDLSTLLIDGTTFQNADQAFHGETCH